MRPEYGVPVQLHLFLGGLRQQLKLLHQFLGNGHFVRCKLLQGEYHGTLTQCVQNTLGLAGLAPLHVQAPGFGRIGNQGMVGTLPLAPAAVFVGPLCHTEYTGGTIASLGDVRFTDGATEVVYFNQLDQRYANQPFGTDNIGGYTVRVSLARVKEYRWPFPFRRSCFKFSREISSQLCSFAAQYWPMKELVLLDTVKGWTTS